MAGNGKAGGSGGGKRAATRPSARAATATPKGQGRGVEILRKGLIVGVVCCLVAVLVFLGLYVVIDIPDENRDYTAEQSQVYFADGKTELGRFAVQKRDSIPLSEMPENLKNAVVAAENRTFWEDEGIDPKGIIRAVFNNAQGADRQGASTITQQYVKLLYLTQEQSYTRKVKEAILALKIQRQKSKQEVLQGYLNAIYFGRGAYGVQTAAQTYFDKPAKKLSLKESAFLAAMIKSPNGYDPANGREAKRALKARYAYVLDGMADMDLIPEGRAQKIRNTLPKLPKIDQQNAYGGQRGHVLQLVREELVRLGFSEEEIEGGGLKITTTLDPKTMQAVKSGVLEERPSGFSPKELHVGAASVEPGTGAIRGIYGGQDFLQSQINWAVAGGQAGSTFKAFALPAAIESGLSLRDYFDGNSPYVFPDGSDVENQGDQDYGSVSMISATENSVNTAFIDMTMEMEDGPEKIVKMSNKMGIPPAEGNRNWGFPTKTPGLNPFAGVALGSQTVSPINMANGYATIAAGGEFNKPYIIEKVVDANGVDREIRKSKSQRAFDEDIAADVSYALQQVVQSGSGTAALGLGRPAAGKTGTATRTDGAVSSAWFTGYTPQLSTAVMYVRGKGQGQLDGWLPSFFGGDYPAETWTNIMQKAMEGKEVEDFPEPEYVDKDDPDGYDPPPPPTTYAPPEPETTKKPKPAPSTPEHTTQPPKPDKTKSPKPDKTTKSPDNEGPIDCEEHPNLPSCQSEEPSPEGGGGGGGDSAARAMAAPARWWFWSPW